VRAELLQALPAGGAFSSAGRYFDQSCRFPLHIEAETVATAVPGFSAPRFSYWYR
jgi:hypothetical protein